MHLQRSRATQLQLTYNININNKNGVNLFFIKKYYEQNREISKENGLVPDGMEKTLQ
jgi:hypothetical protein